MGTKDRASNAAQDTKGRVKEAAGSITGNDDLKNKGKVDQAKAELKNAGEDLKDAAGKVKDTLT
ncbi:MAG: CsbD family protein [Acidimicrobiales bacterium]